MILTKTVEYRGKQIPVAELKPCSMKLVDVKCPVCGEVRNVAYSRVVFNGHHMCQKCALKLKRSKQLETGAKYGRLTVVDSALRTGYSICECECGNQIESANWMLKNGIVKSCGCLQKEKAAASVRKLVKKGAEHHYWKGGISSEYQRTRATKQFKDFLKIVRERDKHQCQKCGVSKSRMHVHHIKPVRFYPELMCEPDNGVLLCPKCHREFHKLHGKDAEENELKEYLSN